MTVEVRVVDGRVLVRPAAWWRRAGIAFAATWGTLLAINVVGAVAESGWLVAVAAGAFGLAGLQWALVTFTASVEARADGLRVRAGLLRRFVGPEEVESIRVAGPTFQSHFVLVVVRTKGRPRRLRTVRQMCTAKSRRDLEEAASELSRSIQRSAAPRTL